MKTRTANNEAASGENAGPGRGPWVLADGKRLLLHDDDWWREGNSLEVLDLIERALMRSAEDKVDRLLWLQKVLAPVQQAWASKLAQALDSLEPGLSARLPAIALQRLDQPSYCNRAPFPSVLDKPEILAMACAYLYWRDGQDQAPMPWSTLNRVCGVKAVQLAQHLHSATGTVPCPVCAEDAEVRIVKRVVAGKSGQRPDGELICGACGHTESLAVGNPREQADAALLACDCTHCTGKRDALGTKLRASVKGLAARIAARVAAIDKPVRTLATDFNAAPLTPNSVSDMTNAIVYAPRHDNLINTASHSTDDWHTRTRPVHLSFNDLKGFLLPRTGGADLKVGTVPGCTDTESVAAWCLAAYNDASLAEMLAVPDGADEFRAWIRRACRTRVLMGFIPVPITIEMTLRERPAPRQPSPMDSAAALVSPPPLARSVRQQPDFPTRIADAIALLNANGYVVVHRRNLE
jgi:hypothetical protein